MLSNCEDHIRTQLRDLWLICFPEDSSSDVDTFLNDVYAPENMLTSYEGNRLVAMLHIIPFCNVAYLYAIATHPDFRHQGRAGSLIMSAIERCKNAGIDALTLIPETARLRRWYETFGFVGSHKLTFPDYSYDYGTGDKSKDIAMILPLANNYYPQEHLTLFK